MMTYAYIGDIKFEQIVYAFEAFGKRINTESLAN